MKNEEQRVIRRRSLRFAKALCLLFLLFAIVSSSVWAVWIYRQIMAASHLDEAAHADVICVFGAAEYNGRPSRILRARLEHALELYRRGIAPTILTLGGSAPGDNYSEGGVGAAFMRANGVPASAIIAETESRTTEESIEQVIRISRRNGFSSIVVVSDPPHVFRIRSIFAADGMRVLVSPRPTIRDSNDLIAEYKEIAHEILGYTFWRLHSVAAHAL